MHRLLHYPPSCTTAKHRTEASRRLFTALCTKSSSIFWMVKKKYETRYAVSSLQQHSYRLEEAQRLVGQDGLELANYMEAEAFRRNMTPVLQRKAWKEDYVEQNYARKMDWAIRVEENTAAVYTIIVSWHALMEDEQWTKKLVNISEASTVI